MPYIARPPMPLGKGSQGPLRAQLRRIANDLWLMFRYTITPSNPMPDKPEDPPAAAAVSKDQLQQCQKLFDEVEATRNFLEAKARATFSIIAFLVPLTASVFGFLLNRATAQSNILLFAEIFVGLSVVLMILAFISIARAVSVQQRETLGLRAIINFDEHKFRRWNSAFRAGGLLYCASMNQAMNGHIAQLVKGAHVFTTIAVLALIIAAVPSGLLLQGAPQSAKTELMGPVTILSTDIADLRKEVGSISGLLSKAAADRANSAELANLSAVLQSIANELNAIKDELVRKQGVQKTPSMQPTE